MAAAILKLPILRKPKFSFHPCYYPCQKLFWNPSIRRLFAAATETVEDTEFVFKLSNSENHPEPGGDFKVAEWKKLSSKELGISTSMISKPTRVVLIELKKNGYDVYLVGGCVRDLILKRIPKDFDILTSAELREVTRTFPHCEIVGKRFPICHVHIGGHAIEVSSFSTGQQMHNRNQSLSVAGPISYDVKDEVRWRNCMQRDFTVNGLMFDPFARLVFDYLGGLEDIKKSILRTINPASASFREDCARILRAIRIAARLGLSVSQETAEAVQGLSPLIFRLNKGRILMELNYMLAYGSAEASLRLLWRFGLLELILPLQAAYFVRCGFQRCDSRSNMLLAMFANLDKLLAADKPCHSSLWLMILAFHKALSDQARVPSVIAAFALAVNNGGHIDEAVTIASSISRPTEQSFGEILEPQNLEIAALRQEVLSLVASVHYALSDMTNVKAVSNAMAKYPQALYSDLVFIPLGLYLDVCKIFECVENGRETGLLSKQGGKINYEMLAAGQLQEVRHIFARVVFDTLHPGRLVDDHTNA
ncbi:unnamed protein product [Amaranthus hypochondriacus]